MHRSGGKALKYYPPSLLQTPSHLDFQRPEAVYACRVEGGFKEAKASYGQVRHLRDSRLGLPALAVCARTLEATYCLSASQNPEGAPDLCEDALWPGVLQTTVKVLNKQARHWM